MQVKIKKSKIQKVISVFLVNILFLIIGLYFIESILTLKQIRKISKRKEFNEKVGKLSRESKYSKDHPFSINIYGSDSLMDYFKSKGENVSYSFSPGARRVILNNGFQTQEKKKIYPFTSINNSRTIFCGESGFWVHYVSDRFGFRNEDSIWDKKDIDAVFIGDSFTHGACVDDKDTFSGIANSNGINSINLGMGGTGSLIQLAAFKEYIVNNNIQPKYLVLTYYAEDIRDIFYENKSKTLKSYIEDEDFTQNLVTRNNEKNVLMESLIDNPEVLNNLYSSLLIPRIKKGISNAIQLENTRVSILNLLGLDVPEQYSKKKIDLFKKTIKRFKQEASKINAELLFVFLPSWDSFSDTNDYYNYPTKNENYLLKKKIINHIKDNDIELLDVKDFISLNGDEEARKYYNFEMYGHFTPEGYKIIGEYISRNLNILINSE